MRIIELKNKVKNNPSSERKRKPKSTNSKNGAGRHKKEKLIKVRGSQFKQNSDESVSQFLYRVKGACRTVLKEAAFQDKYEVDIIRDSKTGEVRRRNRSLRN